MGSIGRARDNAFPFEVSPINNGSSTYSGKFYAGRSGRLYLFVNDGINPFSKGFLCPQRGQNATWHCYNDNNEGNRDGVR